MHAANDDRGAGMHNVMSYDRRWTDQPHHGDHVGRTIQALGELVGHGLPAAPRLAATQLLDRLVADLADPSARMAALALIGLARADQAGRRWIEVTARLAGQLRCLHEQRGDTDWNWFEPALAYDNARLPQALIVTGARLSDAADLLRTGLDTLVWLGDQCGLDDGLLRLSGHLGRRRGEDHPGGGDEQPIDANALVEAEIDGLRATGDPRHGDRAHVAFAWFAGCNRLATPLYERGDGWVPGTVSARTEVNMNEGAESTLAYLLGAPRPGGGRASPGPSRAHPPCAESSSYTWPLLARSASSSSLTENWAMRAPRSEKPNGKTTRSPWITPPHAVHHVRHISVTL